MRFCRNWRGAPPLTPLQIRLRGLSITFFVLCIVCYSFGGA